MSVPRCKKKKTNKDMKEHERIITLSAKLVLSSAVSNAYCYREADAEDFEKILNAFCLQMNHYNQKTAPIDVDIESSKVVEMNLFRMFREFGRYKQEAFTLMCGTMIIALDHIGYDAELIKKVVNRFYDEMKYNDYRWYITTVSKELGFDCKRLFGV